MVHEFNVGDIIDVSGVKFEVTRVYKKGAITAVPVQINMDGRVNLDNYSYEELISAAARKREQVINESKAVIGVVSEFFSDELDDSKRLVEIDTVLASID